MNRLLQQTPVYVVGIGLHPYQFASDIPYEEGGQKQTQETIP